MPNEIQRIYWDACCFIAVLNNEPEALTCISILNEAKNGDIELVISPLTMAETVRPKDSGSPLPKESREKVLAFFDNDYIKLVNFDREMALCSLDICWDYGLKPRDPLHLAMAILSGCDALETLDGAFMKRVEHCAANRLVIRRPTGKGQTDIASIVGEDENSAER